jgi:hypothetical protein
MADILFFLSYFNFYIPDFSKWGFDFCPVSMVRGGKKLISAVEISVFVCIRTIAACLCM